VTPLAATATHPNPGFLALLLLAGLLWGVGYLVACWLYPFAPCRRCAGSGKRRAPWNRRAFRLCNRCDGDGHRLRTGRLVLNYLRDLHDKGTR
jgi:hypothetical protein